MTRMVTAILARNEAAPDRLAYLAGFFDGEGCIQLHKANASGRARSKAAGTALSISVVNTVIAPLYEAQAYFGGTVRRKVPSKCGRKPVFYWMLHGKKAAHFLSQIVAHLVVKKQQAEAALTFAETYFMPWRHSERVGFPLTAEALILRKIAFRAFRAAINPNREVSWQL